MIIFRGVYGRAVIVGLLLGGATGQLGITLGLPIVYPLLLNVVIAVIVGHQIARASG